MPPQWSADLCKRLQDLGKTVECFTYAGQPHSLVGQADALFMQRAAAFYAKYLK